MKFGYILRNLREEKGLSQVDLAKQLNITSQSLSQYELNKRMPDIDMINRLANYFNVSVDYLLGRTEIKETFYKTKESANHPYTTSEINILEEIHNLSSESQEEIKKLIELYKMKDIQDRNSEVSDEVSKQD